MHSSTTAVDLRPLIATRQNYSRNTESRVKVQEVQQNCLTLEDGTDRLSRKVGNYQSTPLTSQKSENVIYTAEKPEIMSCICEMYYIK